MNNTQEVYSEHKYGWIGSDELIQERIMSIKAELGTLSAHNIGQDELAAILMRHSIPGKYHGKPINFVSGDGTFSVKVGSREILAVDLMATVDGSTKPEDMLYADWLIISKS
jgi:hypothetical protein